VRAARAEGCQARQQGRHLQLGSGFDLPLGGLQDLLGPWGRRPTEGLEKRNQALGDDRRVKPARLRHALQGAGEALAPYLGRLGHGALLAGLQDRLADLLLQEAAPLLHDDYPLALLGQLPDQLAVHGIAHAQLEDGKLAQQPQLVQRLDEVCVCQPARGEAQRLAPLGRVEYPVQTQAAGDLRRRPVPRRQLRLLPPCPRRQQHPLVQVDGVRVQPHLLADVERGILIRPALHRPAAVGQVVRQQVTDVQLRSGREPEAQVNEVLDLLRVGRLDDGNKQVLGYVPAVGGHLGGVRPGVVSVHHHGPAVGVPPGEVAQGKGIGGDVHADGLDDDHPPAPDHLRPVQRRAGQGLVVVDDRPDALLVEQVLDQRHGVEEAGDRAAGVAPEQVHAPRRLQSALEQQLVAGEYLRPLAGEESWIDLH